MKAIYLIIFSLVCFFVSSEIHYENDGSTDSIKHLLFSIGITTSILSFGFMIVGI